MRRFLTDILVRDNRLKIMEDRGIKVSYEILSDENYIKELKNKVVEEAGELCNARDMDELKEEISDLLEVLEHIIDFHKINKKEIEEIKISKQQKIGKFEKRIKTHYVEMDENHEGINYYLERKDKYPEVV